MNQIRHVNELINPRGATDLTDGEIKTIASFVITNELKNKNSKYLEIGVLAGATIRYLKQYTKTTQFTGVDLFEDFITLNKDTNTHISGTFKRDDVAKVLGDRVNLIKGNSHNILPSMQEKFDFIFIDGNHTYEATLQDFNNAQKLLTPNGQIAFHNASSYMGPDFELYVVQDGGPWFVCQELIMNNHWRMVECVDRLKVFKKVN